MSSAFAILGQIAQRNGNIEEAEAFFIESDEQAKRGSYTELRGNLARATTLYEEALAIAQGMGMRWGIALIAALLGHLAYQQQNYALAKARYQESLRLFQVFDSITYMAWCLEGFASTACAEGNYAQATRLCAAATLREQARTPLPPTERETIEQVVATARTALDEPAFVREWNTGTMLTQEEAIDDALSD